MSSPVSEGYFDLTLREIEALADNARPRDDLDYGSDRQMRAENSQLLPSAFCALPAPRRSGFPRTVLGTCHRLQRNGLRHW